jgi:hypothetical protein
MNPKDLGLLQEQDDPLSLANEEMLLYVNNMKTNDDPTRPTRSESSPNSASLAGAAKATRSSDTSSSPGVQRAWTRNEEEKRAAWEMYIELVTRVPIAPLGYNEGILREALSSIYSLFHAARAILCNYGPTVAHDGQGANLSFGHLAIRMLNTTLRPLLSKWHPLLEDYEVTRASSVGMRQHERQWERYAELRAEIAAVRKTLIDYANAFARLAGISPLIIDIPDIHPQEVHIHQENEEHS